MEQRFIDRYWSKAIVRPGECWSWNGSLDQHGYGKFAVTGNYFKAYRASYEIHYGPIPAGLCVLHKCDNRICSNPEHLFLGTRADNVRDMCEKGRQSSAKFLTKEQVKEARDKWPKLKGKHGGLQSLADSYGVNKRTLYGAVVGLSYNGIV